VFRRKFDRARAAYAADRAHQYCSAGGRRPNVVRDPHDRHQSRAGSLEFECTARAVRFAEFVIGRGRGERWRTELFEYRIVVTTVHDVGNHPNVFGSNRGAGR
jgi:hypothetical protein